MNKFLKTVSIVAMLVFLRTGFALSADQVYFYYTDPAGTPLAMSDASGTVVWRADYMPFGEETVNTSTVPNNKMFVGKEKDSETGLYYFGARYLDSGAGRFISPDPIGAVDLKTGRVNKNHLLNPQRLNFYVYAINNPYRYLDPDGNDLISSQRRIDGITTYFFYDTDTGAEYMYTNLKENAPKVSPKTGKDYGPSALLAPETTYELHPRPDPGTEKVRLKKGMPVYTTPGQEVGVVLDPNKDTRTWIGPHVGTISEGCPLFPPTAEGIRDKKSFDLLINYYESRGGTTVYIK